MLALVTQGCGVQMPFGKLDWPPGCIDYVVNLIRPAALPSVTNLRATVFWTLMSRALVFETLQQAESYREVVLRAGGSCPDIVTMDGSRLRGNGVVTGSSFAVAAISAAPFRFSQLPASQVRVLELCCCAGAVSGVSGGAVRRIEVITTQLGWLDAAPPNPFL